MTNLHTKANENLKQLSKTGIASLDKDYLGGGIPERAICLIAGRPNYGREFLVNTIGMNNIKENSKILFISINNSLDLSEIHENKNQNVHIIERTSLTLDEFENIVTDYKNNCDIDTIIVSSIQLIRLNNGEFPNKESESMIIVEGIKKLTNELSLKSFVVSEVNRACEKREDSHPTLLDLRGVSTLIESADSILTVWSEEPFNNTIENPDYIDISVVKSIRSNVGLLRIETN